jgi:Flp pilus assembly pilin Flp
MRLSAFLRDESGGTVEWILTIIAGALLAVVIMSNLKSGVEGASKSMGDALQGK